MFKLKSEFSKEEKRMRSEKIKSAFDALPSLIPEILKFEIGLNAVDIPRAFDLVLIAEFENTETLAAYTIHQEHRKVVDLIAESKENTVSVDFYF
jgi:hypothetical protein